MPALRPLDAIFRVKARRGSVPTGVAVGSPPPSPVPDFTYVGQVVDLTALDDVDDTARLTDTVALCAVNDTTRVTAVSIAAPGSPTIVSSFVDATNLPAPWRLAVSGTTAAVLCSDRVAVINASNPASMSLIGAAVDATRFGGGGGIAASGSLAVVTDNNYVTVVDLVTATVLGSVTAGINFGTDIAIMGNYAIQLNHSLTGTNALQVIDISTPAAPALVASYSNSNLTRGNSIVISGATAFVSCVGALGSRRITAINLTNPASPAFISRLNDEAFIGAQGSRMYGADYVIVTSPQGGGNGALVAVDVSDPSAMSIVDFHLDTTIPSSERFAICGDYVVAGNSGSSGRVAVFRIIP